jgi:hypothetical protein
VNVLAHTSNLSKRETRMTLIQKRLKHEVEKFLDSNPELDGFETQDEFDESYTRLGGIEGDGSNVFVCRKNTGKPFNDTNMVQITVENPLAYELVTSPAIHLGGVD